MELAPDEVVEDGRPVAVLVDEVQLDGRDPRHPILLIQVLQGIVVEEQDELDVREPVPLALREGAVHHRGHQAFVFPADAAHAFDHGFLLEHRPPYRPALFPGCYLSTTNRGPVRHYRPTGTNPNRR